MAPAQDELSSPGSSTYNSNTMTVGDGTWDFSKNTFLLPNLQGLNFDTMRYNGMGNRFSTLKEYHTLVLAHAVMGALVFLLLIPFSVMTVRFYSRSPGWAVKYHAQINVLAALLLLAAFILGFFAVGLERSLTNPHHGIGVAIFVLFFVQLVGGRIILRIMKLRSLRIMLHQWIGRAIALLGIVQVPLGLTLYGSPKYLFVLYTLWMTFLLFLYFVFSYRSAGRRELYMSGARSEATRTRVTESEYFASDHRTEAQSGRSKWLAPLAGAGIFAFLMNRRNKNKERERSRSRSRSRGPEVIPSRHGSSSYLTEKYSELPPQKSGGGGGGFMKVLGGAAAAIGAGKLVSSMMNRRRERDDDYSAVSTETPRRHRPGRPAMTETDYTSDYYTDDLSSRRPGEQTRTTLIPPSGNAAAAAAGVGAVSTVDSRYSSQAPVTPTSRPRPSHNRASTMYSDVEESDYRSYVSPSRRPQEEPERRGFAKGLMGALGIGFLARKLAARRQRREEERLRDEESSLRSGTEPSRYTGDGHPSPTRRPSRRPAPVRRPTGYNRSNTVLSSEMSESVLEDQPPRSNFAPATTEATSTIIPVTPVAAGHSAGRLRNDSGSVSMPAMPPDPQGILAGAATTDTDGSHISPGSRPARTSSRRRRAEERAAAVAAGRSGELDPSPRENRERYDSPSMSVKLKVHDDRDRNVTLRRLTEEEAMAARGRRESASKSNLSGVDSPTYSGRYRRDSSQRRAETAAERRAEDEEVFDHPALLSPPNPAFAKGRKAKDSAYYSGQAGPSGANPIAAGQTVSSLGSFANSESHGTWSGMSPAPSGQGLPPPAQQDPPSSAAPSAAADNRRRRRLERRRASESRPSGADMFD